MRQDPHGSSSAEEWIEWLGEERRVRLEIYKLKPAELVAAYRRDREHTRDYHGRELLELLQNADDASEGHGSASRVLITLDDDGLCVANTGIAFNAAGITSLMVADVSPKRLARNRYIGNKGLGFR